MTRASVPFVLLVSALLLAGCGQTGTATIGYGQYWYVLPWPTRENHPIGNHGIYWETRNWTLRVDEFGKIELDGVALGEMKKGDELRVTWAGEAFLNGLPLTPADARAGPCPD